MHLSGMAFTPSIDGTEGTSMVHSAQLSDIAISSLEPKASPSFTGKLYSTGAFFTDANRSVIRGTSLNLYFQGYRPPFWHDTHER